MNTILNLKNLFKRGESALSVQTAREHAGGWDGMIPLYTRDSIVYENLRRSIPLVDAALDKIERLVGGCVPVCAESRRAQAELEEFFGSVRVGAMSQGIDSFIRCYLDSLLVYGTAVGEVALTADGQDVAGLYNAPIEHVHFKDGATPLDVQICAAKNGLTPVPVPYPQLVVYSALSPRAGELRGTSLLSSLPFVSEILTKIFSSVGQNFERIANLRYAVTYRPGSSPVDRACAKDIAGNIAKEWADAMSSSKSGNIKDFVAVGDVDIKVIGADNQMLDTEVPVRHMLEQIVAKLGIPPFLLGLSWSTSERMSAQQADILTSELESYRRLLTPVLMKISTVFLRLRGYSCTPEIVWDNINLQDELELASARRINLEADGLERDLAAAAQAGGAK